MKHANKTGMLTKESGVVFVKIISSILYSVIKDLLKIFQNQPL